MARPRQPTNLILAKGTKHFSQDEIKERLSREVQPCVEDITAPSFLSSEQTERFNKLAGQLQKIKIMGETDCEVLARYVIAQEAYEQAVADMQAAQRQRQRSNDGACDIDELASWVMIMEKIDKRVERYFKQAQTAARSLGLTIADRCKLVVPVKEEKPKANKFAAFDAAGQKGASIHDVVQ